MAKQTRQKNLDVLLQRIRAMNAPWSNLEPLLDELAELLEKLPRERLVALYQNVPELKGLWDMYVRLDSTIGRLKRGS
jgi:hypothetical protein